MAPAPRHRPAPTTNATDLHRQWLELVDTEGPFLAIPPLKRVWPNGIPDFRSTHPDRFEILADARKEFEVAWEALDRHPENEKQVDAYRAARDTWVQVVLRDVIGWAESMQWEPEGAIEAQSPNRAVTVHAHATLTGSDGTGAVVHVVDPADSLRQTPSDLWAAHPVDRLEAILRANQVEIGIVTDGRWWGLVCASEGRMTASGIVDALTWVEEPRTRDAFLTLTARQHIIGGDPAERLPALFEESVAAAEEITEALGAQVRRAVELLIQSFAESAADAKRRGQPDPLPSRTHDTYEAAVTVMMRTVFLLFAEERGLLPSGELFEQGYGISRELDRLAAREAEEGEEPLDATSLTWHRLLATSQALFRGASFENLRMPAYGGSLFDPARFPFLTATTEHGTLAVAVSDRVMLHVLRSVQVATVQGEARHISFRDIDVEQIGYIYEGLLGYTCSTVDEAYLGLIGTTGVEPEIPLAVLEQLAAANSDPKKLGAAIREWVAEDQPSAKAASAAAMTKAIKAEPDPSAISALTQAVGDDLDLRDRMTRWLGLIRRDLRNHPFVVLEGGLLVKETPSRKNAGAHYTPKSLAEEVVLHALQPLCYSPGPHQTADEASWKLKSSDELLDLKVADIACGSGAFLVAAARYLADRIVEAWTSEDPANAHRKDLYTRAIRQVVANCLYGADINDMAVEMCKLSLWLVSLDRDLPFSFVDDKVLLGNSLLGITTLDQLRKLHIDPSRVPMDRKLEIFDVDIDAIIRKAVDLRERLATEIDEDDPARTSAAKHRQLREFRQVTESLREIADGVIATGLPLGGKPGRSLDDAYETLRLVVKLAHPPPGERGDRARLERLIKRGLAPSVETDYERWQPLHWVLAAPDVVAERNGFDCIIGNPPFLVSKKISGAIGVQEREWIVENVAGGKRGPADLVAYFLLRIGQLLRPGGCLGVITSKVIAEGDTREVALEQLLASGLTLTTVRRSEPWPVKNVSVRYALLCGTTDRKIEGIRPSLDGTQVKAITALLTDSEKVSASPLKLAENSGRMAKGVFILGDGFIIDADEAAAWMSDDPRNADVLRPLLNGEDVNTRPDMSAPRWVIDFFGLDVETARTYPLPFERVLATVKPERDINPRKPRRENWWLFAENAVRMRRAISDLDEVLVISIVGKALMPVRVDSNQVFTSALGVCATESYADQAVLSSSVHQLWALTYGSMMRTDPRYTPSDVFETFPRPDLTTALDDVGRTLDAERREIMLRRELGITKLYNLVNDQDVSDSNDPDVARLREVHVRLDESVVSSYGWSDVSLGHGFHSYREMERWTVNGAARVELLDRLLKENNRRATPNSVDARRGKSSRRGPRRAPANSRTLFS